MFKGFNAILIMGGVVCSLLWGFITAMTFGLPLKWCQFIDTMTFSMFSRHVFEMTNGFYYDVNNNDMPTEIFLILFALIFALVFWLFVKVERQVLGKTSLGIIVFFSILLRFIALPGELIHENDIYRYMWDGKTIIHHVNPYKYAPAQIDQFEDAIENDLFDEFEETTENYTSKDIQNLNVLSDIKGQNLSFFRRIGHKEVPTIYPPAVQVFFTIPAMINSQSLILMKFLFVLFDIGNLFLIIALLKHCKRNPNMSIVYGWSPLVIFEIANGGHYDSIPIFFTLLSVVAYIKRRQWVGSCHLALATLSKFFSVVLLPILLRPFKIRYAILFGILIIASYAPFMLWDEMSMKDIFEGFLTYNKKWSYNASIFAVVYLLLEKLAPHLSVTLLPAKMIVGCLYFIILLLLSVRKGRNDLETLHKCFLATAILFIINPVADPWYFCWVMPFLCIFPYRSWYLLSGLLMLSYLNFHSDITLVDQEMWGIPLISWITYVPFFIYWGIEHLRTRNPTTTPGVEVGAAK